MLTNVRHAHMFVKVDCAWVHMVAIATVADNAGMRAPTKPQWRPTYLRQWREHRGLSQDELAPRLEIDRAHLSKIERGVHPYTQSILEAAADELGCTVMDLLTRKPDEAENIFVRWPVMTDQQRRQAIRLFNAITEDER